MEQENKNKAPKKHKFIAPLVLTAVLGATSLGLTGCPSPVGGGKEQPGPQPEPEHEHKYTVEISKETYYEGIRWKDKSGKELGRVHTKGK